MPEPSLQKAPEKPKEAEKNSWHPMKIEPRRLVITADKPKAVFKSEVMEEVRSNEDFPVKNRANRDVKVRFVLRGHEIGISFEEMGDESGPFFEPIYQLVRPQEIIEVHVSLSPSKLEKLTKKEEEEEGMMDEEIRLQCMPVDLGRDKYQMEVLKVVFSDKELTEKEKEVVEKWKKEEGERWKKEKARMDLSDARKKRERERRMHPIRRKSDSTTVSTIPGSTVTPPTTSTPGTTATTAVATPEEVEMEEKTKQKPPKRQKNCVIM